MVDAKFDSYYADRRPDLQDPSRENFSRLVDEPWEIHIDIEVPGSTMNIVNMITSRKDLGGSLFMAMRIDYAATHPNRYSFNIHDYTLNRMARVLMTKEQAEEADAFFKYGT